MLTAKEVIIQQSCVISLGVLKANIVVFIGKISLVAMVFDTCTCCDVWLR